MNEIESATDFADRIMYSTEYENLRLPSAARLVEARDAAIAAKTRRDALASVEQWADKHYNGYHHEGCPKAYRHEKDASCWCELDAIRAMIEEPRDE